MAELAEVVQREKFDRWRNPPARLEIATRLLKAMRPVKIVERIQVCRDPKDDKFLELAVNGRADFLISSDLDLRVLHPFQGIPIISPPDFVDLETQ